MVLAGTSSRGGSAVQSRSLRGKLLDSHTYTGHELQNREDRIVSTSREVPHFCSGRPNPALGSSRVSRSRRKLGGRRADGTHRSSLSCGFVVDVVLACACASLGPRSSMDGSVGPTLLMVSIPSVSPTDVGPPARPVVVTCAGSQLFAPVQPAMPLRIQVGDTRTLARRSVCELVARRLWPGARVLL
jgi:hypothetical protein